MDSIATQLPVSIDTVLEENSQGTPSLDELAPCGANLSDMREAVCQSVVHLTRTQRS